MRRKYSRLIITKAATLMEMVESEKFVDIVWTYPYLAQVLDLNIKQAKEVIYYLRNNASDFVVTVGTYKSNYELHPSQITRDYIDGQIDQYRQIMARYKTGAHQWGVLGKVDPNLKDAELAARQARYCQRQVEDLEDLIAALLA